MFSLAASTPHSDIDSRSSTRLKRSARMTPAMNDARADGKMHGRRA
jgi:hypothetical protein